jgi:hypothetical protein
MNAKSVVTGIILASAVFIAILLTYGRRNTAVKAAEQQRQSAEITNLKARAATLEEKLAGTEKERDRLKAEASEVYKLRAEVSTLRKAREALEKQAAQQARVTPPAPPQPQPATNSVPQGPAGQYAEVAQDIAAIRKKMSSGTPPTAEEMAWLQQIKPELEKLESSPQEFAAFQTAMIQNVAGVSDPEKVAKIQQAVQKVYENAVNRGLTLQQRQAEDPAWVEQRHQLDRRGTTAIQRILDENERAAFDRSFLGVMGVDLGTGVDKALYPPGFLRE